MALAYIVLGRLGLLLVVPPEYATLIWPPTGIALGALLLYGRNVWPGILLGASVFNVWRLWGDTSVGEDVLLLILSGMTISVGSTLQAVLGYSLVKTYVGLPLALTRIKQAFVMFVLAGPLACFVAATVGTLVLWMTGTISGAGVLDTWATWWLGDIFGIIVFLPFMLLLPLGAGGNIFGTSAKSTLPALAIFAVILPLGLSFYSWKISSEYIYAKNKAYFERFVRVAELTLVNRLESYKQNLGSSVSFFIGHAYIGRQHWKEYVDTLDLNKYTPGINGLGYIIDLSRVNTEDYLAEQKAEMPDFAIHPDGAKENFVITYLEPVEGNREAIGLNIAFEKNRYDAAVAARDTASTTITRKITLVQDNQRGAGFLMMHPVYNKPVKTLGSVEERRKNFRGWIYAPFIGRDFIGTLPFLQNHMLNVMVYDSSGIDPDNLIFSTPSAGHRNGHRPFFTVSSEIPVLQQKWTVQWSSTPEFEATISSNEPEIILVCGVVLSALLGVVIFMLSHRAETVQMLVAEKVKEIASGQNKMALLIKHTPAAVAMFDRDMRYIAASDRWYSDYDVKSANIVGTLHYEVFPEVLEMPHWLSLYKRVLDGEVISSGEESWLRKDGRRQWIRYALHPWYDVAGQVGGLVMFTEDITQKKEIEHALRASEEQFRAAMEYASIGKALVDLDGRFIKVNRSLCQLLGYSEDELMTMDFQGLTHAEDLGKDMENLVALLEGAQDAYQIEKRYIQKSGGVVWAILSVSLVRAADGSPQYFVSEINDITQAREMERIKDEFISITSHELRTPITSINLALNLLAKTLPDDISDDVKRYVDMAYRNSGRLIHLINDILDLKKISAGVMEYEIQAENISEIVRQVVHENSSFGDKYGVTFRLGDMPDNIFVMVDHARLAQVMANLLSNAAKFSRKNGVVDIWIERSGARARVCVKDSGAGIPPAFQSKIFQKFSQADSSMTRKQEGTGLGLFLCKEMVEKMGGSIGFVSSEGEGSTFWFEFDEVEPE